MGLACTELGADALITLIAMWATGVGAVLWAVCRLFPDAPRGHGEAGSPHDVVGGGAPASTSLDEASVPQDVHHPLRQDER